MSDTPNLTLPYLAAGQAQKHVTLNESLRRLDAILHVAVLDRDLGIAPNTAPEGTRYIISSTPSGAWAGKALQIAAWQDGGWAFYAPRAGWTAYIIDEAIVVVWSGSAWVSIGTPALNPVSLLGIATTADATNKLALASPASLFNHAGAGHQLKINKAAAAQTGSVLFQTGFSGRAEFGLTGDDDFHVKVSADGTAWNEALVINRASGAVSMPNTATSGGGVVKQVKVATRLTGFTTTSAVAVSSGLSVTLVPTSVTNRVLVRVNLTIGGRFWYTSTDVTIMRGGTKVWPQGTLPAMRHTFISASDGNSNLLTYPASFEFVDQPNTTSAVTYEVFLASSSGAHNVHLNLREHDLSLRGESSIIATEMTP